MMGRSLLAKLGTLEQWCIGWAETDIERFLADPRAVTFQWLKPTSAREILADPFIVESRGRLDILAERLVYGRTRGSLVRLTGDEPAAAPVPVLDAPFHLSYPFVVKDGGRRYIVPEQAESGRLAFYPFEAGCLLSPVAVVEGLDAVDPTFLFHEGLWWLFCTRRTTGANGPLHLYFAESLFGPYTAHPQNPIVTDESRARPAGRIIGLKDRLLRPGQDCTETYGAAIVLSEIEVLSPTQYRERPVQRLTPTDVRGGFTAGLHTIDHTDHLVVIDTKRWAPHPLAWAHKVSDRLAQRG